ncbi:hypothetical protein GCM10023199_13480 [Actinomycetospora chibensis]
MIVAAEDEGLVIGEGAEDPADDGLGGVASAQLLPAAGAGGASGSDSSRHWPVRRAAFPLAMSADGTLSVRTSYCPVPADTRAPA